MPKPTITNPYFKPYIKIKANVIFSWQLKEIQKQGSSYAFQKQTLWNRLIKIFKGKI